MKQYLMSAALMCSIAVPSVAHAKGSENSAPPDARQQVLDATRAWTAAEDKHDAVALGRILDDKFISTPGSGGPVDKETFIKKITAGAVDPTQSQSLTDETVVIDGDTAVAVGTDIFHSANKAPLRLRYTITYVHRQARWLALGEHVVVIPPADKR
jgi:ketosteroid isomerase-like protein